MPVSKDIIKSNRDVVEALLKRMVDNNLTSKELAAYCKRQGNPISVEQINAIFKPTETKLSETKFIWMIGQLGIEIEVKPKYVKRYEFQRFREKYLRKKDAIPL